MHTCLSGNFVVVVVGIVYLFLNCTEFKMIKMLLLDVVREYYCHDLCGTMPLLYSHRLYVYGLLNLQRLVQVLRNYLLYLSRKGLYFGCLFIPLLSVNIKTNLHRQNILLNALVHGLIQISKQIVQPCLNCSYHLIRQT